MPNFASNLPLRRELEESLESNGCVLRWYESALSAGGPALMRLAAGGTSGRVLAEDRAKAIVLERMALIQSNLSALRASLSSGAYRSHEFNEQGNLVERGDEADVRLGESLLHGANHANQWLTARGWKAYPTDQDCDFFGVWVHTQTREVFTYCEGDRILVSCSSEAAFCAELDSMAQFYGTGAPAMHSPALGGKGMQAGLSLD